MLVDDLGIVVNGKIKYTAGIAINNKFMEFMIERVYSNFTYK